MMGQVLFWWAAWGIVGLFCYPMVFGLLRGFWGRGWIFGKIAGMMIVTYAIWLGGILKILPFTRLTTGLVVLGLGLCGWQMFKKNKKEILKVWKEEKRIILFEELVFLTGYLIWVYIRGHQPDIIGLEKFMDYGFVKAALRSKFMPPHDMWLAGGSINYYYFGHLMTAVLTKLTGIKSEISYNLMMAALGGLILAEGFALARHLIRKMVGDKSQRAIKLIFVGSILAALMLTFGGNLQILFHWRTKGELKTYWYPDATRFIIEKFGAQDNTIHEFPMYSLTVSDLHGHLLNLPNTLFLWAIILVLGPKMVRNKTLKKSWKDLLVFGFFLGAGMVANAWDWPIYLLFLGMQLLVLFYWKENSRNRLYQAILKTLPLGIFATLVSYVFSLPFQLTFKNFAQGVAMVDYHTTWWMFPYLWGFPFFVFVVFAFLLWKEKRKAEVSWQVWGLFLACWILILIPEFLRVKDIYIQSHQRANTLFKLTYQAYVAFSIAYGFVLVKIARIRKKTIGRQLFLLIFAAGTTIILIYPKFAIGSYYNNLKRFSGLNGISYLAEKYPGDWAGIAWLEENVAGAPVIVEAVGESYTDFARISANTGLPTILGWRVHEWLWRGTFDIAAERTEEVKTIYEAKTWEEIRPLLEKYKVKFIYVGALEKEAYPNLSVEKFEEKTEAVFREGATVIYKL